MCWEYLSLSQSTGRRRALAAHACRSHALTFARVAIAAWLLGAASSAMAHEIAWVWPGSDAPPERFAEAAVVVETLLFHGEAVQRRPRSRPLVLNRDARVVPVIHIESRAGVAAHYSVTQREAVIAAVHAHTASASAGRIQLDFEAPGRQREAFIALVAEVRAALRADTRLSVTALASWCGEGGWLGRLAADEVVPMLYRLGPAQAWWRERWGSHRGALDPRCRAQALGASMQEPPPAELLASYARVYWFNERNWSRTPHLQLP